VGKRGPDLQPRKKRTDITSKKESLTDKNALMKVLLDLPSKRSPEEEQLEEELDDLYNVRLETEEMTDTTLTKRDRDMILRMASYQLTAREIQSILQIPQAKWDNSLLIQDAFQRGQEIGKATLRRLQWATAQRNPIMQIFLGKQYLGQADRHEVTKPVGEPVDDRQGFADKLKNIIDVTPTRDVPGIPDTGGEGSRQILLAPVGEGQSDSPDEGGMAQSRDDNQTN